VEKTGKILPAEDRLNLRRCSGKMIKGLSRKASPLRGINTDRSLAAQPIREKVI